MAELHVQRKRNNFWWLWLFLILMIAAAVYYYINYYHKNDNAVSNSVTNATTADTVNYNRQNNPTPDTTSVVSANTVSWDEVNFNLADTTYAEVKDNNVKEKANDRYVIYSVKESALFDDNKRDLSAGGKTALEQIGASINQRFKDADMRIYSHIDSFVEKGNNHQLAAQRAEEVKLFLINNGKVKENHISIFPADGASSSAPNIPEGRNNKGSSIDVVVKR